MPLEAMYEKGIYGSVLARPEARAGRSPHHGMGRWPSEPTVKGYYRIQFEAGAGVKTVVLFFEKGAPRNIRSNRQICNLVPQASDDVLMVRGRI
jgi:hypothetical protein